MQEPSLIPSRSFLWIGANIGAAVLIILAIIRIVATFLISSLVSNVSIVQGIQLVALVLGVWLGIKFGIYYVSKRSRITTDQIGKISAVAGLVPLVFTLLYAFTDFLVATSDGQQYTFPGLEVGAALAVGIITIFLTRYFLQRSDFVVPADITAPVQDYKGQGFARLLSLLSFLLFGFFSFTSIREYFAYESILEPLPMPWLVPLLWTILAIGSLAYFVYLEIKERKRVPVSRASFISIVILLGGILIVYIVDFLLNGF